MLQICFFGKPLCGVKQFAAADAGTPDADIVRIFQFRKISKEAMLVEEVDLLFAGQFLVTGQRDNLYAGCHHQECHVKTNLVVTGSRRTVGNSVSTNLFGITGNGDGLENTLATDGDGVAVVAQHIAKDHVFQRLLVILLGNVECHVGLST